MRNPLYENGTLICPNCKSILLTEENRRGEFQCIFCKETIDRLSEDVMKKMLDDFPSETIHEWKIEMRARGKR